MSTCFDIQSSTGSYSVCIEVGLLEATLRQQTSDVLIADEFFAAQLRAAGREAITLLSNENLKSLDAIPELIISLRKFGANRQTALIALGGGVVQDVVAFVASIYMRGLKWTFLPSTLLAMVDSCIGGKSSINVGPHKNLIGTFHPPQSILIDPRLALSLSDEQRISGLIEAVKICFCRGNDVFQEYIALRPSVTMSIDQLERVVIRSLMAKKWFIESDEFDRSERLLLNFGHTFGHAIEGASNFQISHGIGVAIGILCAIELGRRMGRRYVGVARVRTLEEHLHSLLADVHWLRKELAELSAKDILDRFESDKKHGIDHYSIILVAESGAVEIVRLAKDENSRQIIGRAIENAFEAISSQVRGVSKANEI